MNNNIEKESERIQAWLEIEPWPLQWHDAMLYPLNLSSQLESTPVEVPNSLSSPSTL